MNIKEKDAAYVAATYNRFPIEIVSGSGSLVYDEAGNEYIDMTSGIGVTSFGISDAEWKQAIISQIGKVQHMSNLFYTKPCADLAEMLCSRTGMKKVFFSNSGAEANECAIKVARKYIQDKAKASGESAEDAVIVTLYDSFHGRTLATLAATGQDHYHEDFLPVTPGFAYVHAGDIKELKALSKKVKVAAVMLECIQGEGGVIPLDSDYIKAVRKFTEDIGALMIVDEVQTGNGRTGALYAYMNYGITPDIVTTAKGLAGGLPLGATLLSEKVENVLGFGDHGSTYGGNPVSCAAALSILPRISDALLAEIKDKGKYIFDQLSDAAGIEAVTGAGLMIGIKTKKPASKVVSLCREKGVLCLTAGEKVRLLPALNIERKTLEKAIDILKEACKPEKKEIKKVMVIGSGPIVIGQAAEFDYAGTQACRVLKEEGLEVVLVNSNPATIMTDNSMATEIYLEALNAETIARIIDKERPDGLLAGLGGQTGLTIAMQLKKNGILDKYDVELLGTDVEAIDKAEDRELFRDTMKEIGQPCVPSDIAEDVDTALAIAEKIGYPIIVRPAFTLGGTGGGIADTPEELKAIAKVGLDMSPITQVLIEKCIAGWKEIEFETMRDSDGNAIIVCSMENVDPVGVHTGDSIVVAPALTLNDREFNMLKQASLDIVSAIGIIGGCNCQFALKPDGSEYAVIEVNPRVSRSSALASKATGYPIAKITAKLALGYKLADIANPQTGASLHGFEPDVDYIVCKFPKWPFEKFAGSSRKLGTQMKATGEVMSIAPTFEMAMMKAVRGAEIGFDSLNAEPLSAKPVRERLAEQDDRRIFTVFEALKSGVSIDEIYEITMINPYFLEKLNNLAVFEKKLETEGLTPENIEAGRLYGYPEATLAKLAGSGLCKAKPLTYRIVKTCQDVFGTDKPYFYSCADGDLSLCEARSFKRSGKPVVMVLGSGPIRIGQGIEFDYSSVHCVWTLQDMGYDVVIVNNNPETVSTDYDTADRLYFEPLTPEDVMGIIEIEKPVGVVVAFGGQTAIKLTQFLDESGIQILGTSAESIDIAEDRSRFDDLLESFGISRPKSGIAFTLEEAIATAEGIGYPVLLRPSYVIGGQNMTISHSNEDTERYMKRILAGGIDNPVLIDKYMPGVELEVDVISDGEEILIPGIMEHVERAGVHSGDSIALYPPYNLTSEFTEKICDCSTKLALALGTKGLVNIQYLIYEDELYVIEVNPRASRTIPYISKVTGVPMVDLATNVMLGAKLKDMGYGTGLYPKPPYYAAKVPVFSFEKLLGANSILGPEMKSTGEVLGIGRTITEALFKGLTAAGFGVPSPYSRDNLGVFISTEDTDYKEMKKLARRFYNLQLKIYATSGTAEIIKSMGIPVTSVENVTASDEVLDLMADGSIQYIVYTGAVLDETVGDYTELHHKAMQLDIPCFTSIDTASAMVDIMESRFTSQNMGLVDINHM